ncbi:MAG: NAD(+)/NADH kinase [Actinomycetota bacterium]
MRSIQLVVHPSRPQVAEAVRLMTASCSTAGVSIVQDADGSEGHRKAEAVIALGGDGTILRAARIAFEHSIPLLGINLGNLGYLSSVGVEQIDEAVKSLAADTFSEDERMMLDAVAVDADGSSRRVAALNEIVIERDTLSRIIHVHVSVGPEDVATYAADGFIVSTPTGSTAYSLSAGGPVVEPSVDAMILTSVSAHAPLWRSIVVGPSRTVTLEIPSDKTGWSADGQGIGTLEKGAKISIRPHEQRLRLISLDPQPFFQKLRSRFRIEPNHESHQGHE